jgi:TrmH family RNA methyltransferase
MTEKITSLQNPKIKEIIRLRKTSRRKRLDLIAVEGATEIKLALAAGYKLVEFYFAPQLARTIITFSAPQAYELGPAVFKKISGRENPDGFFGLFAPRSSDLSQLKLKNPPLIVVLESVEKPGNLGAVLRTAEAAGADAVFICDPQTDIFNPNVIRASRGAVFSMPTFILDTPAAIKYLHEKNIKIFAATDRAHKLYFQIDWREAAAIVIGTEHAGLGDVWLKAATESVRIPMHGRVDSLNASVSAAVIIYEVLRQRGQL